MNIHYNLGIVRNGADIAAVICARSLGSAEIAAVFHRQADSGRPLADVLQDLKRVSQDAGYGNAWENRAAICLGADEAVFYDFQLPTANPRTAKKTLTLMLESEFPFDASEFAERTIFFSGKDRKKLSGLTTLVPLKTLDMWRDALGACSVPGAKIQAAPWPVINGIKKQKENTLLLCLPGASGSVSALNAQGRPLRIRQLTAEGTPGSEEWALNLARKSRMLLNGLPFQASRLLFYGPGISGAPKNLEKSFGLPVQTVGEDAPLCGRHARLGEDDPARLVGFCLCRPGLDFSRNGFNIYTGKSGKNSSNTHLWLGAAGAAILLAGIGVSFLLDSLQRQTEASRLQSLMLEELRAALPDAPKNAGMGRLRSILNSRLAELENSGGSQSGHAVLKMLDEIHAAIPPSVEVDIHRLGLDDRHVRLYGRAANYEAVNMMKEKLAAIAGIKSSRIVNAANRTDREKGNRAYVEFELDLARNAES